MAQNTISQDINTRKNTTVHMSENTPKTNKKQSIIDFVNAYFNDYSSMRFTLRQLYYRLVATQVIKNTKNEYKYVSKTLTEARYRRIKGIMDNTSIDWERIEDRGRTVIGSSVDYTTINDEVSSLVRYIKRCGIHLSRMLYQPDVVIILLEKEALEGIFEPICRNLHSYLLVGKGYSSFTALAQLAKQLNKDNRKLHVKIFTDYDSSGLDIERYMKEKLKGEFNVEFSSIERIALTLEQVIFYNLPHDVLKKTDARTKNTTAKFAVELDALEPRLLQDLIEKSIRQHYDKTVYREVERLERVMDRRFRRKLMKEIEKIFN